MRRQRCRVGKSLVRSRKVGTALARFAHADKPCQAPLPTLHSITALSGKLSNARFWRVFASLSGLCLGQSWLGQSLKRCACVAGWNVCATRSKDVIRVADLGGDDLDDCLGVARIYFCALRNVETSPRPDCEPRSARPKIAAIVEVQEVRFIASTASAPGSRNRFLRTASGPAPERRIPIQLHLRRCANAGGAEPTTNRK